MLNNFFWNEVWTFRGATSGSCMKGGWGLRLVRFQAICGAGIGFAVLFLNLFYTCLHFNLYGANFLAILLVTLWNFWMNTLLNWRSGKTEDKITTKDTWRELPY